MKKKEGWRFKKLVIFALAIALVASFVAMTAYTTDGEEPGMTSGPQTIKRATPATQTEPIHNPAGSEMIIAWLSTVPTCDGYIDAVEWEDANMYDISDTTGQHDGVPDPLGTVYLWLKQDDVGVYFAVRNMVDQTLDNLDQVGLYFDDNYDGCFPASATTEGNHWVEYHTSGSYVRWRWLQDFDCGFPPDYTCSMDNQGGGDTWSPTCFGIGIGPLGVVDYEIMIPYGSADEYLDLAMPPDSLGFFIYCEDVAGVGYQGTWPSQGRDDTWREPCYYGHLICRGEEEWLNHKMHYPQLPDPEGWDICATKGYDVHPGIVAADDFMCTKSGPITDIHFWGSWLDDVEVPILGFQLSIHEDGITWPGTELWSDYITDFEVTLEGQSAQGWFEPWAYWYELPNHNSYFRYDIDSIPEPFYQDSGTIYWLMVMADIGPPGFQEYSLEPEPPLWGWKTSRSPQYGNVAVWSDNWMPPAPWFWRLFDPITEVPLDLAFVITSETNNPPYEPSNPSPPDGAIDQSIEVDLAWTGGDPDPGNTVTYDIYFGDTSPPVLLVPDHHSTTYDPGTLDYDTQYFWRIVARDPQGAETSGPEWDFTTEGIPVTCGDVNDDGIINVGDVVYMVTYLYRGGPAPIPNTCVGDVNNDDIVNVGDVVYLVTYLYRGGPAPNPLCCTPPWAAE